ncbi:MAG: alpha-L-fucosidase [Ginsengibacter sp.]
MQKDVIKSKDDSRRAFLRSSLLSAGALLGSSILTSIDVKATAGTNFFKEKGAQRLSLEKLKGWEALGYGMFIHFGLSTFVEKEIPDGSDSAKVYAPDHLDVDQWIRVAKNAGMKYAVLTAKHCSGHCLWPSKYTDYTVENSGNKTDVVLQFIKACKKYGVLPGLYYNSIDNHHKFGSQTLIDLKPSPISYSYPKGKEPLAPFTSSMYQNFMTDQLTELFTQYGPIAEIWIDNPGILSSGYRTYLYHYLADLQPQAVIMMNSGIGDGAIYNEAAAWPSDLIAIEISLPPTEGHKKWREIKGKTYYMPAEVCDPIGKDWFYMSRDQPRTNEELTKEYLTIRNREANFLLDVPPDKGGVIPDKYIQALLNLKRTAGIN